MCGRFRSIFDYFGKNSAFGKLLVVKRFLYLASAMSTSPQADIAAAEAAVLKCTRELSDLSMEGRLVKHQLRTQNSGLFVRKWNGRWIKLDTKADVRNPVLSYYAGVSADPSAKKFSFTLSRDTAVTIDEGPGNGDGLWPQLVVKSDPYVFKAYAEDSGARAREVIGAWEKKITAAVTLRNRLVEVLDKEVFEKKIAASKFAENVAHSDHEAAEQRSREAAALKLAEVKALADLEIERIKGQADLKVAEVAAEAEHARREAEHARLEAERIKVAAVGNAVSQVTKFANQAADRSATESDASRREREQIRADEIERKRLENEAEENRQIAEARRYALEIIQHQVQVPEPMPAPARANLMIAPHTPPRQEPNKFGDYPTGKVSPTGLKIFRGPKGGEYHIAPGSGNKVYH